MALQAMKKSNYVAAGNNFSPMKPAGKIHIKTEEHSAYGDVESEAQRQTLDGAGSLAHQLFSNTNEVLSSMKNSESSASPTPESLSIKKTVRNKDYNNFTNTFVKKGYLSSDNQSSGSKTVEKNSESSGLKHSSKKSPRSSMKKSPHAAHRKVNLHLNNSNSKENLMKSRLDKIRTQHSKTMKTLLQTKGSVSDSEIPDSHISEKRLLKQNVSLPKSAKKKPQKKYVNDETYSVHEERLATLEEKISHFSETTEESEDPLHERSKYLPSLKVIVIIKHIL